MRARRTPRTTLVAAGVAAALGAPATGAFAAAPEPTPVAHGTAERVHVKTVRLADKVSVAKVHKTGKHRYEVTPGRETPRLRPAVRRPELPSVCPPRTPR
ncbi:hypothetical protein ACIRU3_35075 [Streptomyces sp. NPDC101151]|uniref:hypothetical protein n=1 Tax=Streptomyces sp. NPDC101151 TaxID=3366115 RepID=UPI0038083D16